MKKLMFALCFMFGGIVAVSAQETQDTTSNQYRTETQSQYPQDMMQDQDRERIQATELPDEVKRSLEGEEYRGWLISGAFKSKGSADQSMDADSTSTDPNRQENANAVGAEGEEVYIVELKNGAETKSVRFSSDGQKLEGQEEDLNNQNNQMQQPAPTDPTVPSDQTNPSTPSDQTVPSDPSTPTDPNATQQPEHNQSSDQSTTPADQTPQTPDQSTQTPDQSTTPEQSTGTQTDQSKTNGPK